MRLLIPPSLTLQVKFYSDNSKSTLAYRYIKLEIAITFWLLMGTMHSRIYPIIMLNPLSNF